MQITNFKVKDRTIYKINNIKLIGVVGQDAFKVTFLDSEWENLHKTLKIVRSDGKVVKLALLNDLANLTAECYVEGEAKIGFYGTINEDDPEEMKIASTDYFPVTFLEHAYDNKDGIAINEPTPSQWDIIIGQLNDIVDEIDGMKTDLELEVSEIETKLENGDFDGRGIVSINKISTSGDVDTYEILYTDNTKSYFTVTNGGIQTEEDPTVPNYVKSITQNDINSWNSKPTTQEMTQAINDAIGSIVSVEFRVVDALPQTGEAGVIYLISNDGDGQNIYDEYIWIESDSQYEMIGTTEIDLSQYYTKTETDLLLDNKMNIIPGVFFITVNNLMDLAINSSQIFSQDDANKFLNLAKYKAENPLANVMLFLRNTATQGSSSNTPVLILSTKDEYSTQGSGAISLDVIYHTDTYSANKIDKIYLSVVPIFDNNEVVGISSVTLYRGNRVVLELESNKVSSIDDSSTNIQYPGAKCVYENVKSLSDRIADLELLESNLHEKTSEQATYHNITDALHYKIKDMILYGNTSQDTSKLTYTCLGTESGDYYFVYNTTNYQFTMPTVTQGDVLVFDTISLKLYKGTTQIVTTTASTGTLITLSQTPNSDYEVPFKKVTGDNTITICRKNIFDGAIVYGGYDTGTGAISPNPAANLYRNEHMIKVKPSTTYTFSIDGVSQKYCLYFYDANKRFIRANVSISVGTFTVLQNAEYLNFRCYASDYTSDYANLHIQLEEGSIATSYEPYTTQTQLLSLGSTKLYRIEAKTDEIVQDYIYYNKTSNKWYKHKAINDLTVTSSQSGLSIQNGSCVFNVSDIVQSNVTSKIVGKKLVFANILRARNSYYRGNSQYGQIFKVYSADGPRQVAFDIQGITTKQQVLDWVDEHELKIIYVLEEPIEEEITDATLIGQLNNLYNLIMYSDVTNIFTTTANKTPELQVSYLRKNNIGDYNSVITDFWKGTQAQYDAITNKSDTILYIIIEE